MGEPVTDAPNSRAGRRRRWQHAMTQDDPAKAEPKAIILSVRLDNGAFESSVTIPLTEHIDFDKHAAAWLALAHVGLRQGVSAMEATLSALADPEKPEAPTNV